MKVQNAWATNKKYSTIWIRFAIGLVLPNMELARQSSHKMYPTISEHNRPFSRLYRRSLLLENRFQRNVQHMRPVESPVSYTHLDVYKRQLHRTHMLHVPLKSTLKQKRAAIKARKRSIMLWNGWIHLMWRLKSVPKIKREIPEMCIRDRYRGRRRHLWSPPDVGL